MPVLQRFRLWYQFDVVRRVYSLELGTPSSPLHKVRYVVFTFDLRPLAEGRIAVAAALPPRDSILQNRLGCRTLELPMWSTTRELPFSHRVRVSKTAFSCLQSQPHSLMILYSLR